MYVRKNLNYNHHAAPKKTTQKTKTPNIAVLEQKSDLLSESIEELQVGEVNSFFNVRAWSKGPGTLQLVDAGRYR